MQLSHVERWILSNQFLILEALYPDQAGDYKQCREVIENGYELNYDWISEHIYHNNNDVMTEDECREVIDILTMFTDLKFSYEALSDKSEISDVWIRFAGFDGNNETKQMHYTRFIISRFPELEQESDFNSHAPFLRRYREMLEEWRNSRDQRNLTRDDLIRICQP